MNFKDKELIIFDFDGTLINSIPDLALAVNTMLSHYNLEALTVEEVTPLVGNGAKALVQRSLKLATQDQDIPQDDKEAFQIYYSAYKEVTCKDTYAYSGVMETLTYLKDKGYEMAICTNKPQEFIAPILDELGMTHFFKNWIGEDSLAEKKPSAVPLLHLAKEMNICVSKCIMVGDSKNDILAAQNAEMDNIGVTYGYNYDENIADYQPTIVVDQFSELQKLF